MLYSVATGQAVLGVAHKQPASSTQAGRQPRQPRCVSQQQPARVLSRLVCSSCNNRRRGGPCNNKGAVSQQQALASSRPSVRSSHRNQVSLHSVQRDPSQLAVFPLARCFFQVDSANFGSSKLCRHSPMIGFGTVHNSPYPPSPLSTTSRQA